MKRVRAGARAEMAMAILRPCPRTPTPDREDTRSIPAGAIAAADSPVQSNRMAHLKRGRQFQVLSCCVTASVISPRPMAWHSAPQTGHGIETFAPSAVHNAPSGPREQSGDSP